MLAVKSAAGEPALASMMVATTPLNATPSIALTVRGVTVTGASPTTAVLSTATTLAPAGRTLTETGYEPSSG